MDLQSIGFRLRAWASAALVGVAYLVGIVRIGDWLWQLVLDAERQNWYGLRDIPVLGIALGGLLAFGLFFGGIYSVIVLPILAVGYVHDGFQRISPTRPAVPRTPVEPRSLPVVVATFHDGFGDTRWLNLDRLMSMLESVGGQLEAKRAGSRFPLLWRLAPTLTQDAAYEWSAHELGAFLRELEQIEKEFEPIPASVAPRFSFGSEGYPEVYSRDSPQATGTLRSAFQSLLDQMKKVVIEAQNRRQSLVIHRKGPAIHWWDA